MTIHKISCYNTFKQIKNKTMNLIVILCLVSIVTYFVFRLLENTNRKFINAIKFLIGIVNLLSTAFCIFFLGIMVSSMLEGFNPGEPHFGIPWWYKITQGSQFYYWSLVSFIIVTGFTMFIMTIDLYYRDKKSF